MRGLVDVVAVEALGGHRLRVRFGDGVEGVVDVSELVRWEGVFALLRDQARFEEVFVHPELGVVTWPDGADLDSGVLYEVVAEGRVRLR